MHMFIGEDRKIRLWDLASGDLIKEMRGHTDTVKCLEFNQDGSLLCSGSHSIVTPTLYCHTHLV